MSVAAMPRAPNPQRPANIRLALILAAVAVLCYVGIYAYYVFVPS